MRAVISINIAIVGIGCVKKLFAILIYCFELFAVLVVVAKVAPVRRVWITFYKYARIGRSNYADIATVEPARAARSDGKFNFGKLFFEVLAEVCRRGSVIAPIFSPCKLFYCRFDFVVCSVCGELVRSRALPKGRGAWLACLCNRLRLCGCVCFVGVVYRFARGCLIRETVPKFFCGVPSVFQIADSCADCCRRDAVKCNFKTIKICVFCDCVFHFLFSSSPFRRFLFLASGLPYAFIIAHNVDDVKHHPQETFQNVAQSFYIIFVDFAYSA